MEASTPGRARRGRAAGAPLSRAAVVLLLSAFVRPASPAGEAWAPARPPRAARVRLLNWLFLCHVRRGRDALTRGYWPQGFVSKDAVRRALRPHGGRAAGTGVTCRRRPRRTAQAQWLRVNAGAGSRSPALRDVVPSP